MKLRVTTPLSVVVDAEEVSRLRAEDGSGSFGILGGHADLLTALEVSVVSWHDGRGLEHHVAVRGGVLQVRGGDSIEVATPEAVAADDLERLETEVIARLKRRLADEQSARSDAQRLYLAAIDRIIRLLRAAGPGA